MNKFQPPQDKKIVAESAGVTGKLERSAGSTDIAELRVQVRAQLEELTKRINAICEQRTAAAPSARF